MDDAVRVRDAARDAIADVDPDRLRDTLRDRLADAEMTPGVLTLLAARAPAPSPVSDGGVPTGLTDRAAGVQLIYEGLRLTRQLAAGDAWTDADANDVPADTEVLAADVFVARGFYLLARTAAADEAVEVVRRFGQDQTRRENADGTDRVALDRNLEADVFRLAVVAGTAAADVGVSPELAEFADELARRGDGLPAVAALPDSTAERIAALADATRAPADS